MSTTGCSSVACRISLNRLLRAEFIARHERTYLAEKLRSDWLKVLGKKQQWSEFDVEYPKIVAPDQELACYALQSRRARGDATMLDDALPLWTTLLEPPEPCYPVLEALIWEKRVLADEVWVRVRRQVEANKIAAAARYSTNYLPPSQTPTAGQFDAAVDKPMPTWPSCRPTGQKSASAANWPLSPFSASPRAIRAWPPNSSKAGTENGRIRAHLGLGPDRLAGGAAPMPEAVGWYKKTSNVPLSDEVAQWKVRAALRAQDWGLVDVRPSNACRRHWRRYRNGPTGWAVPTRRAARRPRPMPCSRRYPASRTSTATSPTTNSTGRSAFRPKLPALSRDEVVAASTNPGLKRALALIRVNMRVEGVREWNWTLRGMSDRELLAAAELAKRNDVFDRAIAAADRTKNEHDYSLRYLSPFDDQVRPQRRSSRSTRPGCMA